MSEAGFNNGVKDVTNGENLSTHHVNGDHPVVLVVDDSDTVRRSATDYLTDIGLSS